ncbi:MAG: HEAT repeat domain-containing protein, partial [Planctomycetes bacterium]|nr:HEAT repeat domain-containing protein [Planctomycetota bacterium]
ARGEPVPEQVDDSNTLPFLNPKTNVGGASDPNRKQGKLGSLDYLNAAEQQKLFKLAPGYEINIVASEEDFPELAKPVAINFDNRGRLWVATMPSYPQWQPKTKLDDKLLILEDADGDGRADQCKVFAGGLHQPTGFELGSGGVYVSQQPDVLFLNDTDGDDREDLRIRRLVGFDTADSHHGLAAFEWGPGGALYFQEGTFKQSQVETPYGPVRLSDAGVWRYEPRSENFSVHVSLAFANPWGHVFDRWGQNFIADASPGHNFWAGPISGDVAFPDKHPGGGRAKNLDWGGSKGTGEMPTFIEKRIRPSSGCEIVSGRHFPPEAQGNFLLNNVIGERAVLQHTVRDSGSGFVGTEITPLVSCDDGNFRPVDLQFGPDGALYIVDWHNALIGHLQHNLRDPSRDHSHGRIWRVTYKGRPLVEPPKIAGEPIEALLDLLKLPEDRTRYRVRRELAERDSRAVVAALRQWVSGLDPADADYQHHLLEALWQFQTHDVVEEPLLRRLLESPEPRARAAAVRVLSYWLDRATGPLELLRERMGDSHPRVRLEAVRACSFIHAPESFEVVLEALNRETDVYLEYTITETLRTLEDAIRAKAPQHPPHDSTTPPLKGGPGGGKQHAGHDHAGHQHAAVVPPPLVFLDKSPNIVRYQLNRLTNPQLLAVERSPQQEKFEPVYEAIVLRDGLSTRDREEAVAGLAALRRTQPTAELLVALGKVSGSSKSAATVAKQLSSILLRQSAAELEPHRDAFRKASRADGELLRSAAFAALIAAGDADEAWRLATESEAARLGYLSGLSLVPNAKTRAKLRGSVVESLAASQSMAVRRAAVEALAHVPADPAENFRIVAPLVASPAYRATAVRTLGAIPAEHRPAAESRRVVESLVKHAEATPAAKRTTAEFLDAMQLADALLARLPVDETRAFRDRLREVVVRVVRIDTVEEEMRYDTPYFAVEAGRPVQLVLRNLDLMPHNLLIAAPGAMQEVADLAAALPSTADERGLQYVPKSDKVLQAMPAVPPHEQAVITFTAPSEPGEYPYVCTFPQHWMRMYGVMVVVEDLAAWQANPTKPADPLGQNREFVQAWTLDDFTPELESGLRGRSPDIGARLFREATCLACHKCGGEGGAVGPELTDVLTRWKGDRAAVLREILDPSHRVEPKYTLYNVLTTKGQVISGIVVEQDRQSITVVSNPEKPEPRVIDRDEVEEMIKTSASIMPKALLNNFTRDEVLELLAYLVEWPVVERPRK